MREIKFRGLSLSANNWLFGQYARSLYEEDHYILEDLIHVGSSEWGTDADAIHCKTLGQFTGIADKKGVEIYEGDIVIDKHATKGVVKYIQSDTAFKIELDDGRLFFLSNDIDELKVIGNIHQNPELLED